MSKDYDVSTGVGTRSCFFVYKNREYFGAGFSYDDYEICMSLKEAQDQYSKWRKADPSAKLELVKETVSLEMVFSTEQG